MVATRWSPRGAVRFGLVGSLVLAFVITSGLSVPAQSAPPRALFADRGHVQVPAVGPYAGWASVPQATWLTETVPAARMGSVLGDYLTRARAAKARGVVVLYAIPGRDCGAYSAGGFPDAVSYRAWIGAAARVLKGSSAMVVLEPDAIAGSNACGGAARLRLLRWATKRLAGSGAWVYLDAGHGQWTPADQMVPRLRAAGVTWARGVSLNVSNYRATATERRYGTRLVRGLARTGVKGVRFVIDTSRNGVEPRSVEWCNPTWARLGARPRLVRKKGALDALLWVKHPGESDGPCHGGPAAGQWSDLLAARLTGR